jgi:hypothetical protein
LSWGNKMQVWKSYILNMNHDNYLNGIITFQVWSAPVHTLWVDSVSHEESRHTAGIGEIIGSIYGSILIDRWNPVIGSLGKKTHLCRNSVMGRICISEDPLGARNRNQPSLTSIRNV